jgi:hypothetical protein
MKSGGSAEENYCCGMALRVSPTNKETKKGIASLALFA